MVMMIIIGERFLHLLYMFVVLLLCMKPAFGFNSGVRDAKIRCIEKEREALLMFKRGLVDDYGHLSSWGSEDGRKDCCKWRGIKCSNRTGHVIMLDLHFYSFSFEPLRGRIPTGTQLQSFNASAYMGNLDLCGLPLPNKCPGDETAQDPPVTGGSEDSNIQENEDGFITPGFYFSTGLGFTLGFWAVCGTLLFNSSWRYAYFHFLNDMRKRLYMTKPVNMAKLQRQLRG